MLHLDEGVLHAYLDGAESRNELREKNIERHLETCDECREALERARRLKDRAHEILGDAGPKAVTPMPLSELERWAESRPSEPARRRRFSTRTLAVAATAVFAIAAGWMVRGTLTFDAASDQAAPQRPVLARADTVTAAAPAEVDTEPADEQVAQPPAESAPSVAVTEPETTATRQAPEPVIVADAPPAGARDTTPPDTAPPALVDELRVAPPPPVAARQAAPQAVRNEALGVGAFGGWTRVNAGVAAVHLGSPIWTIPDLPVVSVAIGGSGPGPSVRATQQLDSLWTVELIMIRAQEADAAGVASAVEGEAPAPAEGVRAAGPARNTATVRRGGLLITARAPLGADSLRALVERVRTLP